MEHIHDKQCGCLSCKKNENFSSQRRSAINFFKWWAVLTGLYASTAVCPFCGRAGCPVGVAGAGMVGAFFAFWMQYGVSVLSGAKRLRLKLLKKK